MDLYCKMLRRPTSLSYRFSHARARGELKSARRRQRFRSDLTRERSGIESMLCRGSARKNRPPSARIGIRCGIADPFLHIPPRAGATEKECFLPTSIFRNLPPPPGCETAWYRSLTLSYTSPRARERRKKHASSQPQFSEDYHPRQM